jgi:hypothetical protein
MTRRNKKLARSLDIFHHVCIQAKKKEYRSTKKNPHAAMSVLVLSQGAQKNPPAAHRAAR